jgi:HAD superfamily hydrolase (TIGR01509 family)
MHIPRAVIFDMDGVIVDSEPLHEQAFYKVMDELGYGQNHGLTFSHYVGRSDIELWKDFVALQSPPQSLEDLLEMKRQHVIRLILAHEPIFDGLEELLNLLLGKCLLAVASGSERAVVETVLSLRELRRFFPVVVTAADVAHGKPAPDIFQHTARLLGVTASECWVIEDSKPGVMAGLAAGMRVIAVPNTHPADELRQAHHVVASYEEIGRLLLGNKITE